MPKSVDSSHIDLTSVPGWTYKIPHNFVPRLYTLNFISDPISKPIIFGLHSLVYPNIKSSSLASCAICCFSRQRGCKTRENIADTEIVCKHYMDCLQTLCCWQTTLHRIQWFRLKTNIFQSTNVSHWRHTLDVKMSLKQYFFALDIDCSPFLRTILQMKINKVVLKFCFISSTWVESMKNYKFSRKEKQHELSSGGKILLVYVIEIIFSWVDHLYLWTLETVVFSGSWRLCERRELRIGSCQLI